MASPASKASAAGCSAYTQTTVTTPYGFSSQRADLINVKVITPSEGCGASTVTIYPRTGTEFYGIVSANGGWSCVAPVSPTDPTVCTAASVAAFSSSTIRVQYNRPYTGAPVSGTATSVFSQN